MENLFSYGTLQDESVQLSTFGRKLEGFPDQLTGYELSSIKIEDPAVVASSGLTEHPIIRQTNNSDDTITGTVLIITATELEQANVYEAEDYQRVRVELKSGKSAWVYISR